MLNRTVVRVRGIVVVAAALATATFAGCGSDSDSDGAAGKAGSGATSSGGTGQSGGAGSGGKGAGTAGSGGGSSGSSGSSGAANAGSGGGSSGIGGSASGGMPATGGTQPMPDAGPPPPGDGGLSPYVPECDEMTACGVQGVTCLGVFLAEGGNGFTCSNQCQTVADCSDAPSGTDAEAGCVQFTAASRCVLVCHENGVDHECPGGMTCYRYPDFPIGYCLWL